MKSLKQELNEVFPVIAESQNSFKDWAISQFQTHNNNLSNLADAVASLGGDVEGHTHTWSEITNKPTSFTPSTHTHSISDITNLQSTLDTIPTNNNELENGAGYLIKDNAVGYSNWSGSTLVIPYPQGGVRTFGSWPNVGAIKITMPQKFGSHNQVWFDVSISEYVGAVQNMTIGAWFHNEEIVYQPKVITNVNIGKDYTVRFGQDSEGKICVWIGDTDNSLNPYNVIVTNVRIWYGGVNNEKWREPWDISLATEFEDVRAAVEDNYSWSDWNKIKGRPTDLATESYAQQQAQSAEDRANTHTANNYVPLEGAVTKNGTLTLTSSPVIPDPSLNSHAVSRGYVDERYLSNREGGVIDDIDTPSRRDIRIDSISADTNNAPFTGNGTLYTFGGIGGFQIASNDGVGGVFKIRKYKSYNGSSPFYDLLHTGNLGNVRNVASYSQSEAENRFYNIFSVTGYLATSITDLNDLTAGQRGLARSTVEANTPAAGHNDVVTISQYGSSDLLQIVYPFRGDGKFYLRNKQSSGWSDWLKVWHDGILNPMTTDTNQTITGRKQFDQVVYAPQGFAQLVAPSLRSLKENIKPFKKSGIELITQLQISEFDYKDIKEEGEVIEGVKDSIGIIADDSPDEFLNSERKAVDLYKTIFIQAKAIQELTKRIEELEAKA